MDIINAGVPKEDYFSMTTKARKRLRKEAVEHWKTLLLQGTTFEFLDLLHNDWILSWVENNLIKECS